MQRTSNIHGRAWVFGDNIDTDIIAPADTISFGLGDATEDTDVKVNAFRAIRPGFHKQVHAGDILVAGKNFGLGSHREPANKALVSLGFRAVIAESVARLFFRNAVAIGFYVFQVPGILDAVQEGDELDIDIEGSRLLNVTQNTGLALEQFSPLVRNIIDQGGILEALKSRLETSRKAQ
ncbi:3-isopropylmalate dehydratase [Bordetella sp. BOR01]|uniref:LeuD/DmdB family oxidoreductase small subunit n=1 Tax=Bordetella sp. BOR01 TaxID=2854779 RepID=UPI001C487D19|nr:3-isopropylmalate dehydratase [Bordetella sp. BOR01]MBV7484626.1 3-isopropylmalate dehydratase [Bordetella sp. BOR01]